MIRDIAIVGIIFVIIITSHTYIQKALDESSSELLGELDNLKQQVQMEEKNSEEINIKANEIYEKWQEKVEIWSSIIEHQDVETIEKTIIGVKASAQTQEYSDTLQKIEEANFFISHIQDKEKLELKNIF